jgi:hypothetical protein
LIHQYEPTPQVAPPSSERNRSTPPTQTRFGSAGSTAIVLQYQPMVTYWFVAPGPRQIFCAAGMGFVRSRV